MGRRAAGACALSPGPRGVCYDPRGAFLEFTVGASRVSCLLFAPTAKLQAEPKPALTHLPPADNCPLTPAKAVQGRWCCRLANKRGRGLQATVKFKKALVLDARKHDALWCLGNAYTSQVRSDVDSSPLLLSLSNCMLTRGQSWQGFLTTDTTRAHEFFDLANDCFKRAIAEACPA